MKASNPLQLAFQPLRALWQRQQLGLVSFWQARSDQERRLLRIGGLVGGAALFYALLIAPAVDGRAQLQKDLPLLRQEAAEIEALALQAGALAQQAPAPAPPMSKDSLTAALAARGLSAASIGMTGEYAKLQLKGVPFATLVAWLDAMRREARIAVQDASIAALPTAGLVDASITLHQGGG